MPTYIAQLGTPSVFVIMQINPRGGGAGRAATPGLNAPVAEPQLGPGSERTYLRAAGLVPEHSRLPAASHLPELLGICG